MYTSLSNFLYIQEYISKITLKVSKFQKKIFLFMKFNFFGGQMTSFEVFKNSP